jgi:hypothetical protein
MARFKTQSTPNPNSLKITRDGHRFIQSGMESFSSVAEATGHPLGEALMALPGVANVFILPDFLTVTKTPDAKWKDVETAVMAVLEAG